MVSLCNSAWAAVAQATRQTEDKRFFIALDLVTNVGPANKRPVATGRSDAVDRERPRLANSVRHEKRWGVFPSLPARNERGESWREGKLMKNGLLSPALSSFGEGEGEGKRRCARGKLLAKQVLAARVLSPFAKKSFPI